MYDYNRLLALLSTPNQPQAPSQPGLGSLFGLSQLNLPAFSWTPQQPPNEPNQQFAGYQSPFQRKVYALTPGDLKGPGLQRLIDQAESDQDLATLRRKIESFGGYTGFDAFLGGQTK